MGRSDALTFPLKAIIDEVSLAIELTPDDWGNEAVRWSGKWVGKSCIWVRRVRLSTRRLQGRRRC